MKKQETLQLAPDGREYTPPTLEVITFELEKGFAQSGDTEGFTTLEGEW